ncbi:MAG: sulfite exporter TauE/SafE family protein [Bacteroidales bacterium]|nr:sulfite exporter TauE/SafE family protein [Bacteroidales bacterium]
MKDFMEMVVEYLNNQSSILTTLGLALMFVLMPGQLALNSTAFTLISFRLNLPRQVWYRCLWYIAGKFIGYSLLWFLFFYYKSIIDNFRGLIKFFQYWFFMSAPYMILLGFILMGFHWLSRKKLHCESLLNSRQKWFPFFLMGLFFSFIFCSLSFFVFFYLFLPQLSDRSLIALLILLFTLIASLPIIILSLIFNFIALDYSRKILMKYHLSVGIFFIFVGSLYTWMIFFT